MGMNVQVADLVTKPKHSILTQSYDARERQPHTVEHLTKSNLNGDGFGIGWYSNNKEDKKPCVFTSILPAWNNNNLAKLAEKVSSPLIFAHVRAAYPGMPVSEQNCHPFAYGKYMFMHNGNLGDFLKVRRILLADLREDVYNSCQSFHSDSAVCFAVFLDQLKDFETDYSPMELAHKMEQTMQVIMAACKEANCSEKSLLNFVVSDGKTVIATKFANAGCSASLYMSAGTGYAPFDKESQEDFHVIRSGYRTKLALIASEPITACNSAWTKVPENTMVVLSREKDGDVNVAFSPICCRPGEISQVDKGLLLQSYQALESVSAGVSLSARRAEAPSRKLFGRVRKKPDDLLTGHKGPVISFTLDGDVMYSGGTDGLIGVWDMDSFSGRLRELVKGNDGPVMGIAVTEEHLVSISKNSVLFFSKDSYELIEDKTIELAACGPLMTLFATRDCVAFGGQDSFLRATKQLPDGESYCLTRKAHNSFIHSIHILDNVICTGGGDTMVKLWDLESVEQKASFRGHKGPVVALANSADGGLLFSGSRDNTIRVWDMEELCCRNTISGHSNDVIGLEYIAGTGTNEFLCSVSLDQTCRFWDLRSYECVQVLTLNIIPTTCILVDRVLYVGGVTGEIAEWNLGFLRDIEEESTSKPSSLEPHSPRLSSLEGFRRHQDHFSNIDVKKKGKDSDLVQTLKDFIAIPSISGNTQNREDCFQAAKFVSRLLEKCGAVTKMIKPENQNPTVLARFEADPAFPTITFYGHYDVQPAQEPTWKYNPFEVQTVDGYFYGRGTTDNKGPILAFIFAVMELIDKCGGIGRLPMNIALLIEGEEENGSKGFKDTLVSNKHWFKNTKLIVISNTLWIGKDKACITYGMRGMITMSVEVYGPEKDLHSGNEGGALMEPMTDLMKLLSSLLDSSNKVLIPGFYEGVDINEVKKRTEMFESLKDSIDMDKYAQSLGLDSSACSFAELLSKKWLLPTLSIVEVRTRTNAEKEKADSHYSFGPTKFSVIPHRVVGQISIRFVAKQNPHNIVKAVKQHIESEFQKLRSSNKVRLSVHNIGDAWEGNTAHNLWNAASTALCNCWGHSPLFTYEGGTMPVTSTLEKVLDAPAMLIPLGQSTDNPHLANERIRSVNLFKGKNVMRTLVEEVAAVLRPQGGEKIDGEDADLLLE
jgi:di- and tripeptidase/Cys-Gly metallodipeptidase DUG1